MTSLKKMSKYRTLIDLIKSNNLFIKSEEIYDPGSAWTGKKYEITDRENNEKIFDLSINGFCFENDNVSEAVKAVEEYLALKKMETFDDFKKWLYANLEE